MSHVVHSKFTDADALELEKEQISPTPAVSADSSEVDRAGLAEARRAAELKTPQEAPRQLETIRLAQESGPLVFKGMECFTKEAMSLAVHEENEGMGKICKKPISNNTAMVFECIEKEKKGCKYEVRASNHFDNNIKAFTHWVVKSKVDHTCSDCGNWAGCARTNYSEKELAAAPKLRDLISKSGDVSNSTLRKVTESFYTFRKLTGTYVARLKIACVEAHFGKEEVLTAELLATLKCLAEAGHGVFMKTASKDQFKAIAKHNLKGEGAASTLQGLSIAWLAHRRRMHNRMMSAAHLQASKHVMRHPLSHQHDMCGWTVHHFHWP